MRGSVTHLKRKGKRIYSPDGVPCYRLSFDISGKTGKRKQKVSYFYGTKADAEKEMRRLLDRQASIKINDTNITMGEMLDRWLVAIKPEYDKNGNLSTKVGEKTYERYKGHVQNDLKPALANIRLQYLTIDNIEEVLWNLFRAGNKRNGSGLAPKTIRNIQGVVTSSMAWAKKKKLMAALDMSDIALPELADEEMTILGKSDQARLLKGLEGHWISPMVFVGLTTGMRMGEILGLHWSETDFIARKLSITQSVSRTKEKGVFLKPPKTKAGKRTITITPFTCDTLKQVLEQQQREYEAQGKSVPNDGPVFDTFQWNGQLGKLLDPATVSYYFRTQVAKLSIPKIRFHDLRHTHISQLLNDGHPVAAVSKRAGHKNAAVTLRIYTHAMPGADEIMMEHFDEGYLVRDLNVTHLQEKPQSPAVFLVTPTGFEPVLPA